MDWLQQKSIAVIVSSKNISDRAIPTCSSWKNPALPDIFNTTLTPVTYTNDILPSDIYHVYDITSLNVVEEYIISDGLNQCLFVYVDNVEWFHSVKEIILREGIKVLTHNQYTYIYRFHEKNKFVLQHSINDNLLMNDIDSIKNVKTIALVLNSPIIATSTFGKHIDRNDVVCRINWNERINKPESTGFKTTMRYMGHRFTKALGVMKLSTLDCIKSHDEIIVTTPKNTDMYDDITYNIMNSRCDIRSFLPVIGTMLKGKVDKTNLTKLIELGDIYGSKNKVSPMSGLHMLMVLMSHFQNAKINVYGLDVHEDSWIYGTVSNIMHGVYITDAVSECHTTNSKVDDHKFFDLLHQCGIINIVTTAPDSDINADTGISF